MKNIFLLTISAIVFSACQNNASTSTANTDTVSTQTQEIAAADAPKVEVEKATYSFGEIKQGEKVSYSFKFKNVGKSPLIISDATATCGCTVPEYPKQPIKPGEEGVISVIFDSTGKIGLQDKIVTITSNANPKFDELHLVGEIKENK